VAFVAPVNQYWTDLLFEKFDIFQGELLGGFTFGRLGQQLGLRNMKAHPSQRHQKCKNRPTAIDTQS
jgi:hypothetical protein